MNNTRLRRQRYPAKAYPSRAVPTVNNTHQKVVQSRLKHASSTPPMSHANPNAGRTARCRGSTHRRAHVQHLVARAQLRRRRAVPARAWGYAYVQWARMRIRICPMGAHEDTHMSNGRAKGAARMGITTYAEWAETGAARMGIRICPMDGDRGMHIGACAGVRERLTEPRHLQLQEHCAQLAAA